METMQKTYPGGVCSRLNPNEAVTSTNEYIYMHVYKQFTFWYYKIITIHSNLFEITVKAMYLFIHFISKQHK